MFYDTEHRNVFVARFTKFLEVEFLSEGGNHRQVELDELQPENNKPMEEPEVQVDEGPSTHTLRRSQRISRPPERLYLIQEKSLDVLLVEETDPFTYRESMLDIDSVKWQNAMKSEIDSMHENQVWDLVSLPEEIVPIGCKSVHKRKRGSDGKVETYKARLVAKGYT